MNGRIANPSQNNRFLFRVYAKDIAMTKWNIRNVLAPMIIPTLGIVATSSHANTGMKNRRPGFPALVIRINRLCPLMKASYRLFPIFLNTNANETSVSTNIASVIIVKIIPRVSELLMLVIICSR